MLVKVDSIFLFSWIVVATLVLLNLPQILSSMKLYKKSLNFSCQMCGNCCRFRHTPLTEKDVNRLIQAGHKDSIVASHEPHLMRIKGKCIFLEDDKCKIHDIRPEVCSCFPFFIIYGIGYAQSASFCPALEKLENE